MSGLCEYWSDYFWARCIYKSTCWQTEGITAYQEGKYIGILHAICRNLLVAWFKIPPGTIAMYVVLQPWGLMPIYLTYSPHTHAMMTSTNMHTHPITNLMTSSLLPGNLILAVWSVPHNIIIYRHSGTFELNVLLSFILLTCSASKLHLVMLRGVDCLSWHSTSVTYSRASSSEDKHSYPHQRFEKHQCCASQPVLVA